MVFSGELCVTADLVPGLALSYLKVEFKFFGLFFRYKLSVLMDVSQRLRR